MMGCQNNSRGIPFMLAWGVSIKPLWMIGTRVWRRRHGLRVRWSGDRSPSPRPRRAPLSKLLATRPLRLRSLHNASTPNNNAPASYSLLETLPASVQEVRAQPGHLYLVATPIGHLADMTLRAVSILKTVNVLAAEDTRRTLQLLRAYGIRPQRHVSHREHNWRRSSEWLVRSMLEEQASVALVSDAGTPLISDPGSQLVRAAIARGIPVVAVPGACAALTALTVSGMLSSEDCFAFYGFLPPPRGASSGGKRQRREVLLERVVREAHERPILLHEAPHRVRETMADIERVAQQYARMQSSVVTINEPLLRVCVARELTKLHEEVFRGTLAEVRQHLERNEPRGEYCLVLGPEGRVEASQGPAVTFDVSSEQPVSVPSLIDALSAEGLSPTAVARCVSKLVPALKRKQAYQLVLQRKPDAVPALDESDTASR